MDYLQLSVISKFLDPRTDQASVRVKRKTVDTIQNDNTQRLCKLVFGDKDEIFLSREDLFRINKNNIERFILSVLLWAYPNRTHRFKEAFECWDELKLFTKCIRNSPNMDLASFKQLIPMMDKRLPGIGISTFSKLLYFSNATIEGCKCVILDSNEVRGISLLTGNEVSPLIESINNGRRFRSYSNYYSFLYEINNIANNLNIPAHNIEYTLWLAGNKSKINKLI